MNSSFAHAVAIILAGCFGIWLGPAIAAYQAERQAYCKPSWHPMEVNGPARVCGPDMTLNEARKLLCQNLGYKTCAAYTLNTPYKITEDGMEKTCYVGDMLGGYDLRYACLGDIAPGESKTAQIGGDAP